MLRNRTKFLLCMQLVCILLPSPCCISCHQNVRIVVFFFHASLSLSLLFFNFQVCDDLNNLCLILVELQILFFSLEITEESKKLTAIGNQNRDDLRWFVGIGNKHLEHMESFNLDALAWISQQVHEVAHVGFGAHIPHHDIDIGSVQQDLTQQFHHLPSGDVIG